MSRLIALTVENVKRIKAVRLTIDGRVFTIGGRNAQGKSSVLDAIAYALGGKDAICDEPLRNGTDKGLSEALIECEGGVVLVVRRTWKRTASGNVTTAVTVSQKTEFGEAKLQGAQAILDSLLSAMAFDPMAFSRMKPKEQVEQLKELAGLNTDAIDAEIEETFSDRTEVNRRLRELEGQVAGAVTHPDAPAEEIAISALMLQLDAANELNAKAYRLRLKADAGWQKADATADRLAELRRQVAELDKEHQAFLKTCEADEKAAMNAESACVDVQPIKDAVANANAVNRKVRENMAAREVAERRDTAKAEADALTAKIDRLRVERQVMLESAKWPVDGLGIDNGVVTFNGLPLDQASQSQKIKVGCAIAVALSPKLPLILMRDASLLDDDSLREVESFCEAHDAYAILERVGDGEECSVIIEDGEVRAREPAVEPELAAV